VARADVWMSSGQLLVHDSIGKVGGYWPPLAAVARLLEEIGELVEALSDAHPDVDAVGAELSDIWIISTCIANQFTVRIEVDIAAWDSEGINVRRALDRVIMSSGSLARIVNYYGGPKAPRNPDDLSSLQLVITHLQEAIRDTAVCLSLDLNNTIRQTLAQSISRDRQRFDPSFDPSTAACLSQFQLVADSTQCTFARAARVWGAPAWDASRSIRHNVEILAPYFTRFCRAVPKEHTDGFVIVPRWGPGTLLSLGGRFRSLLRALCAVDAMPNTCLEGNIDKPGWQFVFSGQRLFVSVFSPVYPPDHVRHSQDTMMLFQPEQSFSTHGIGSKSPTSDDIKLSIRHRFISAGVLYPSEIIAARREARIYLLPISAGSEPVRWWESGWRAGQDSV
jgi:YqcI/YcgG family